jgi:geranylgeranyl pyrophosphate synthase
LEDKVSGKDQGKDLEGGWVTLPILLALQDEAHKDEALRLWQGHANGPEGARQFAQFLNKHGYLDESRTRARALLKELYSLSRSLPHAPGVRELEGFLDAMAWRQF